MAGLQFSDTSGGQGLIQACEDSLNFPAAGISGNTTLLKTFTRYINVWYHKVVTMILASQDGWDFDDTNNTDYPVATTPLVASQRDYSLPVSLKILKVKRIDVTYDGSTYYKCEFLDTGELGIGLGNDTNTDASFSKTKPYYDLVGNAVWLYPLPSASDVSSGAKLRIEFYRDVTEFVYTDTTKTPGIDAAFHEFIAVGAAWEHAFTKNLPTQNALMQKLGDWEARLKQHYGQKDTDTQFILKAAATNYQ